MTTKKTFDQEYNQITESGTTMMQKMAQSVERIQNGTPTLEDYQRIMQWPAIAQMFMRSKSHII